MSNAMNTPNLNHSEKDSNILEEIGNGSGSSEILEVLAPDLSEMRYREMMTLFNNKTYEEGIVRTENHARTYLYFHSFSTLSDEEIQFLLDLIENQYLNLKGAIYLRTYKDKKFISIEPLFPNSLEKEVAGELADMMRDLLEKK